MKINKVWHAKHPMPEKATIEQRAAWHQVHVIHCGCLMFPEKFKREVRNVKNKPKD